MNIFSCDCEDDVKVLLDHEDTLIKGLYVFYWPVAQDSINSKADLEFLQFTFQTLFCFGSTFRRNFSSMTQIHQCTTWDCMFVFVFFFLNWGFFFFAAFFLNPISHEPGYRYHVIHCLPSIQVLDRKGKIWRHLDTLLLRNHTHLPFMVFVTICCYILSDMRLEVKLAERRRSLQTHSPDSHRVLQSVAFGRRIT